MRKNYTRNYFNAMCSIPFILMMHMLKFGSVKIHRIYIEGTFARIYTDTHIRADFMSKHVLYSVMRTV